MSIKLRAVTRDNYEAVCDLDVTEQQKNYVACNMWSLVEAQYEPGHTCRAIYRHDTPVGFVMWVLEAPTRISIWRLMVDQRYQQAGIGRQALSLALAEIKCCPDIKEIEICYNPQNPVAKDFYASFGFREIGLDAEGEEMLALVRL